VANPGRSRLQRTGRERDRIELGEHCNPVAPGGPLCAVSGKAGKSNPYHPAEGRSMRLLFTK
jgi:hypothetical protein